MSNYSHRQWNQVPTSFSDSLLTQEAQTSQDFNPNERILILVQEINITNVDFMRPGTEAYSSHFLALSQQRFLLPTFWRGLCNWLELLGGRKRCIWASIVCAASNSLLLSWLWGWIPVRLWSHWGTIWQHRSRGATVSYQVLPSQGLQWPTHAHEFSLFVPLQGCHLAHDP